MANKIAWFIGLLVSGGIGYYAFIELKHNPGFGYWGSIFGFCVILAMILAFDIGTFIFVFKRGEKQPQKKF